MLRIRRLCIPPLLRSGQHVLQHARTNRRDLYRETLKIELAPETDEDAECCKEFAEGFIRWAEHEKRQAETHVS